MTIKKNSKLVVIIFVTLVTIALLYRYSPYKVEFLGHYDKIWAHRANSKKKLNSALSFYNGVELDLVFSTETNILDVNHPPLPSIQLSFEKYINSLAKTQKPYLWLDIKNLNENNAKEILKRLQAILKSRDYSLQKILIETRYPEALPVFHEAGFMTSYYLPSALNKLTSNALELEVLKIKTLLKKQPKLGISTHYKDYSIIAKSFPKRTKYLWVTGHSAFQDYQLIRTILNDKQVKSVLVTYKALSGNR